MHLKLRLLIQGTKHASMQLPFYTMTDRRTSFIYLMYSFL